MAQQSYPQADYGLLSDADFFPSLVNSPKDFTDKDEFLFWGNISHNFKKK